MDSKQGASNMIYSFQVFSTSPSSNIGIDFGNQFGYWQWNDGSDGGSLYFEVNPETEMLELVGFNGARRLPIQVTNALTAQGILVPWEYFQA